MVPVNQAPDIDYYWRVKATWPTAWSVTTPSPVTYGSTRSRIPEITGPPDDQDITDVVLDWNKVDGAK